MVNTVGKLTTPRAPPSREPLHMVIALDWRTEAEESSQSPCYCQLPGSRKPGPQTFLTSLGCWPRAQLGSQETQRALKAPWGQLHWQMGPESQARAGTKLGRTSGERAERQGPGARPRGVGGEGVGVGVGGQAASVPEAEHLCNCRCWMPTDSTGSSTQPPGASGLPVWQELRVRPSLPSS